MAYYVERHVCWFLRRASREYDRYLVTEALLKQQHSTPAPRSLSEDGSTKATVAIATSVYSPSRKFRPNVFQQIIRALFHMVQFAVAYFIMLLAMYFNGYIIISIIIGAFLGAFVFRW
jgi:solute carrier family 31 (copper transporter), member 1